MKTKFHANVLVPHEATLLAGEMTIPSEASGLVLFAHGSGSSRHSPRNQAVARSLQEKRLGTLLFDLLTADEERREYHTGHLRFNIPMLAERLVSATEWAASQTEARDLPIAYFGSSTGAAAAFVAAADQREKIGAVVSRGGRPDLAAEALETVTAPTLLIVGELDDVVIQLNEGALGKLRCEKAMTIIPGATHLFEEPGALDEVSNRAAEWFAVHLRRAVNAH
jgi:putative phosphoribosyl transferase